MNRTRTMMVFGILMMLIIQLSCATAQNAQGPRDVSVVSGEEKEAKEAEVAPSEGGFLADTHKAAGVACSDCHKETPPANETPTDVCLTCHADYRDVALSAIDPHNAHIEFTGCGDCHHAHRESENQCLSCHSFNLKAP